MIIFNSMYKQNFMTQKSETRRKKKDKSVQNLHYKTAQRVETWTPQIIYETSPKQIQAEKANKFVPKKRTIHIKDYFEIWMPISTNNRQAISFYV